MNLFLSPDLDEIILQKPRTSIIKEKYRFLLSNLRKVTKGYKEGDGSTFLKKRLFSRKSKIPLI
jgi:hypothetical protein